MTTENSRTQRNCGAMSVGQDDIRWRVWAPHTSSIELVLKDKWGDRVLPLERQERGYFERVERGIPEGQRYAYRLAGERERPDPCSLWQPDGVHAASAVFRPERFPWTDGEWRGVPQDELVFYELHVGTFTPEGTLEAIIPRLAELRDLGITAIELLPLAQFPGTRNWGYDGTYPYAVQNSYGGPVALQKLVDAAHAAGLAVFLDVVYNHLGPEGNYLAEFGAYFNDRYKTPWGRAVNYDDAGSDPVRDYVLDNVRMWLDEFHLDGLRLDAVHAIYDASPRHILQEIKATAEEVAVRQGRHVQIVAESDLNDPRLLLPVERGCCGLDSQWSDDFHHVVHSLLTGEKQGYYQDYGQEVQLAQVLESPFLYAGNYSPYRDRRHGAPAGDLGGERFVVAIQNHDQVGNRARGDRFGTLLSPPQQRLAASLLLLAPHLPLIFMGEEYGEQNPFQFFCSFGDKHLIEAVGRGRRAEFAAFGWQGEVPDPHDPRTFERSRLGWSWPAGSVAAGLRQLYRDLLAARRKWPALRNFSQRAARLRPGDGAAGVLQLVRGGTEYVQGETLQAFFNLGEQSLPLPVEIAAGDKLLFASEATHYHAGRQATDSISELRPYECLVFGPTEWEGAGE